MGRRLGIIVGVNTYQDTAFRPLQYAENDARALAQWLVNAKGGNWGPGDVQHVQGEYATRELVESLITQTCINVAGPGDLVFVYFAGHTFLDERNGEGYLALANTRYQQPSTGLHLLALAQQTMGRSRAAHVIFMFDCFQTGALWSRQRSSAYDSGPLLGPTILNALQQTTDRLIMCSCRGNEQASEAGEKSLGLFAYRMILGLCGPASDPTTQHITLQRLQAHLINSLREQQRPQLFGRERNPLVLVGDMPSLFSPQPSGPLPQQQSGHLSPAFSPGMSSSPSAQPVNTGARMSQGVRYSTATAQMSPTTSGQLGLAAAEQQCAMLLRQARHLVQMQNPGAAFDCVEQLLQIAPTNVAALILKGQLLGTVGRSQEALSIAERVIQLDPNNALAWSLRAALLTNTGQYQLALQAVERSLELDPNNSETYSIKTSIMGWMAALQSQGNSQRLAAPAVKPSGTASFFIGASLQLLGLALGVVGAVLPIFQPGLPIAVSFALQSLGLALLCVNAARTSYLYGFARFFLTLFTSALAAAILGIAAMWGGVNQIGKGRVYLIMQHNPSLLLPILFFGIWLALAAAVPLIVALGGLIGGLIVRVGRKKQ